MRLRQVLLQRFLLGQYRNEKVSEDDVNDKFYITLGGESDPRITDVLQRLDRISDRLDKMQLQLDADLKGMTVQEQAAAAKALNKDADKLAEAGKKLETLGKT